MIEIIVGLSLGLAVGMTIEIMLDILNKLQQNVIIVV